MSYAPVTPAVVGELRAIVGDKGVLVDAERIEAYGHDETSAEEYGHLPDVVVLPTTTAQIAAIVRLANRERVPITPRGAGSGLSGGAIPQEDAIVIGVSKLSRILEVDYPNRAAVVQAGVQRRVDVGAATDDDAVQRARRLRAAGVQAQRVGAGQAQRPAREAPGQVDAALRAGDADQRSSTLSHRSQIRAQPRGSSGTSRDRCSW